MEQIQILEQTLIGFLYEYWPMLAFVGFGVFGIFARRVARKRRDVLVARTTAAALQQGMDYSQPPGHNINSGDLQGTHRFSGTIRGVAWTAEVTLLTAEADDGSATRSTGSIRYTRWTAPGAVTGGGELLLMARPDGASPEPEKSDPGGFFGGLRTQAASFALQMFIRTNFGNTRFNALSITPESHLPLSDDAFGLAFTAFGNRPDLLRRLSPDIRDWLLKGCNGKAAFLWDPQGLSLTWPTAHMQPKEVAACAEYGAVLANMLGSAVEASEGNASS
jgi:hypothetical protein